MGRMRASSRSRRASDTLHRCLARTRNGTCSGVCEGPQLDEGRMHGQVAVGGPQFGVEYVVESAAKRPPRLQRPDFRPVAKERGRWLGISL
jgi:hypothetical protein